MLQHPLSYAVLLLLQQQVHLLTPERDILSESGCLVLIQGGMSVNILEYRLVVHGQLGVHGGCCYCTFCLN